MTGVYCALVKSDATSHTMTSGDPEKTTVNVTLPPIEPKSESVDISVDITVECGRYN